MVRRQCRQPAVDQSLGEGSAVSSARRLVLPTRQAIVSIYRDTEAALGNREFFLNKPY
jgi:hypothetical protein